MNNQNWKRSAGGQICDLVALDNTLCRIFRLALIEEASLAVHHPNPSER